jgi:4-amino-4-deoxy-L-arabinose transferase
VNALIEAAETRLQGRWAAGIFLGLLIAVYFLPLGRAPLATPDETRYAEIGREMLTSGDWIVPHLVGLRYFEKTPLGYWLIAGSIKLFGESAFAVRLPSALATVLSALLLIGFARRVVADRSRALVLGLAYLTTLEVFFIGTFAVLDAMLTLFCTAGIIAAWHSVRAVSGGRKMALAAGICFGLAFLTKGFVALAVCGLVLVPWLWWEGRIDWIWRRGWLAVLALLATSLPWSLAIAAREPGFWPYFFWVEHIKRFFTGNAQHRAPFYYFLVSLPGLAFPWFSFAPAAVSGLRREGGPVWNAEMRLLALWCTLPFLFFSLSSGKLATYILPCLPPLVMLLGIGLLRYLDRPQRGWYRFGLVLNALVFVSILVGVVWAQVSGGKAQLYSSNVTTVLPVLAAILALIAAAVGWRARHATTSFAAAMCMVVPLQFVIHFAMPEPGVKHNAPGPLLERFADRVGPDTVLVSDASVARAVAWYYRRTDIYLTGRKGEMAYGLDYPDAASRYLDPEAFPAEFRQAVDGHPLLVFCDGVCAPALLRQLPQGAQRHRYGRFVLWWVPRHTSAIR